MCLLRGNARASAEIHVCPFLVFFFKHHCVYCLCFFSCLVLAHCCESHSLVSSCKWEKLAILYYISVNFSALRVVLHPLSAIHSAANGIFLFRFTENKTNSCILLSVELIIPLLLLIFLGHTISYMPRQVMHSC